jgi:carbon monoxide dehydrogenase subunit G
VIIKNRLEFDAPAEVVWRYVLNNIPDLAHCIPGGELTKIIDERTYSGRIGVKLGPINVGYSGTVHIEELDEQQHAARLRAEGTETRGRGGASATVRAEIHTEGNKSVVNIESDVMVSGVVAQFGRTGIIQEVSQKLAERFARCLEQEIKAQHAV